ncbi:MAG TPA: hypothetical protein VLW75_08085 [Rhizomicrobium sp.]|nr:hypothetical protein [Rhizomicrobium sp.]
MRTPILAGLAILALARPAAAGQEIKILIPSDDNCTAFTAAMDSGDRQKMLSLGGWALGFLSGMAQGSGKDILHNATSKSIFDQLYDKCSAQPNRPITVLLQEMAESLGARQQD